MKIKITLERPAGAIDLALTADADATVGDVADALAARDPERAAPPGGASTLTVVDSARVTLDPELTLIDSGIKSGARIAISPASDRYPDPAARPVATITVLHGPDQRAARAAAGGQPDHRPRGRLRPAAVGHAGVPPARPRLPRRRLGRHPRPGVGQRADPERRAGHPRLVAARGPAPAGRHRAGHRVHRAAGHRGARRDVGVQPVTGHHRQLRRAATGLPGAAGGGTPPALPAADHDRPVPAGRRPVRDHPQRRVAGLRGAEPDDDAGQPVRGPLGRRSRQPRLPG